MLRDFRIAGLRRSVLGPSVCALLSLAGSELSAQAVASSGPQRATRAELQLRLSDLERAATSGKDKARKQAALEATAIRNRLAQGDFRIGDRFLITYRLDTVVTDTASVRDSLKVSLLNLPDATLSGVLRSELDTHLAAHLAKYVKNAQVRASVLTRVSVLGAVARPGFYYAAPDRPLSDLLMLAGGPTPTANVGQLEIRRGAVTLVKAKDSRRMLEKGQTLEQADVQSGDDVRILEKRKINWQLVFQLFFILSSLLFTAISFLRWYYDQQQDQ